MIELKIIMETHLCVYLWNVLENGYLNKGYILMWVALFHIRILD